MPLEISAADLLTTTRSVRRRLDLQRPVPRDLVESCLERAFQAPNGSNLQTWNWIVVDDADIRAEMAAIYRAGLADHLAASAARRAAVPPRPNDDTAPAAPPAAGAARMTASVMYLVEHLHEVPVLVVPTTSGRLDGADIFDQASNWGSILPAVWSLMLSLRLEGLGSAWTTLHLHREQEMADLLGIPYAAHTQAGLFPIAYTIGTDFAPADRGGSHDAIRWNRW